MTKKSSDGKGTQKEGQGSQPVSPKRVSRIAPPRPAEPASGGRRRRPRRRQDKRTKESMRRQSMLNSGRITPFKYDMNTILSSTDLDDAYTSSFLATVIAKGTRVSTRDAKEYVREQKEEFSKDEIDRICKLIDRYSRYR